MGPPRGSSPKRPSDAARFDPRRSPRVSRVSPSTRNSSTSTALSAGGASASSPAPNPSGDPNAICLCVRSRSVKNARSLAAAAVARRAAENAASAHDSAAASATSAARSSSPIAPDRSRQRASALSSAILSAHDCAAGAILSDKNPRAPWSPRRRPTAPACARPGLKLVREELLYPGVDPAGGEVREEQVLDRQTRPFLFASTRIRIRVFVFVFVSIVCRVHVVSHRIVHVHGIVRAFVRSGARVCPRPPRPP